MLGNELDEVEIWDCWKYLRIVSEIAVELLPDEPPKYVPSIALGAEIEMGFAIYYMARSVNCKTICCFVTSALRRPLVSVCIIEWSIQP